MAGRAGRERVALAQLTEREREVLELVARRLQDREIAALLPVSVRTIETHVAHILGKLGIRDRREAGEVWRAAKNQY